MNATLFAIALLTAPSSGLPEPYVPGSAGELFEHCSRVDGDFFRTRCFEYLGGIADTLISLHNARVQKFACIPPDTLNRELAAVYVAWFAANKGQAASGSSDAAIVAFSATYPCGKDRE